MSSLPLKKETEESTGDTWRQDLGVHILRRILKIWFLWSMKVEWLIFKIPLNQGLIQRNWVVELRRQDLQTVYRISVPLSKVDGIWRSNRKPAINILKYLQHGIMGWETLPDEDVRGALISACVTSIEHHWALIQSSIIKLPLMQL